MEGGSCSSIVEKTLGKKAYSMKDTSRTHISKHAGKFVPGQASPLFTTSFRDVLTSLISPSKLSTSITTGLGLFTYKITQDKHLLNVGPNSLLIGPPKESKMRVVRFSLFPLQPFINKLFTLYTRKRTKKVLDSTVVSAVLEAGLAQLLSSS